MQAYALQGTPSLLVIDRAGHLRINHFGQVSDMRIAAEIAKLVYEAGSGLDDLDPDHPGPCLLYTSPSPRDRTRSRMPSSA